jgi:phosphatidylserine/phosphatidylglycerophosphate/cardiolipin synthase-like enzyme
MHVFQCGWCGFILYSPSPPLYYVSLDPRLPDATPVACGCRTPARMFYCGLYQPMPLGMVGQAPREPQRQPAPHQTTPRQHGAPVQIAPPQPNGSRTGMQPPPVPAPARPTLQDLPQQDYRAFFERVLSYMDQHDVLAFRLLNHAHRDLAERVMKGWFTPRSFQYAASGRTTMQTFITERIAAAQAVRVSVDQLTNPRLLELLVGGEDGLGKVKGVNAGRLATYKRDGREISRTFDQTFGQFADGSAVIDLPGNQKMHNKFYLVDGDGVITGSPNLSASGLNDNQECIVFIRHPMVAMLFREYFERIRTDGAARLRGGVRPAPYRGPSSDAFVGQIQRFNAHSPVRVALAPFLNIRDFVYEELQNATGAAGVKITMRQFVVDRPGANQKDILNALMKLAREGAEVSVVLDYGQYQSFGFVKDAVRQLKAANVTVYLQSSGQNIMHEKLLLIQFTKRNLATNKDVVTKTALLGSAGFTRNVSENLNYENIIAIDEDNIYNYFMQWHLDTIDPENRLSTTHIVDRGGPRRL